MELLNQLLPYVTIFLIGIAVGCHLEETWWQKLHDNLFDNKYGYSTEEDIDKDREEILNHKF